jgi:hypothetical protein
MPGLPRPGGGERLGAPVQGRHRAGRGARGAAGAGLEARYLEVELTESVMMGDTTAAEAQLAELRAMGVSLSLDDFGTGYSSLGYLSRFSLDKLKIDQAFVRNITTDPRSAAIAQATIALAEGLSLPSTTKARRRGGGRRGGDAGAARLPRQDRLRRAARHRARSLPARRNRRHPPHRLTPWGQAPRWQTWGYGLACTPLP